MRAIKKVIKFQKVNVTVYDTLEKQEKILNFEYSELDESTKLEPHQLLISHEVISESNKTLVMSAKDFLKYAKVEKVEDVEIK